MEGQILTLVALSGGGIMIIPGGQGIIVSLSDLEIHLKCTNLGNDYKNYGLYMS